MSVSSNMASALAVAAALGLSSSVIAQVPVNDECFGAIPVGLGTNGPFTNGLATTSVMVPAGFTCSSTAGTDVWFIHTATCNGTLTADTCGADYDSSMEVYDGSAGCAALVSVGCNDDTCGLASLVSWPATAGTTYYIKVGGWSNAIGSFPLNLTCTYDLFVEGVAEATPGSGTLGQAGGLFASTDTIRWNLNDTNNLFPGAFAAVGLNLYNGPQPKAITTGLPGLQLLWEASTPMGYAFIFPPHQVGAADYSLTIPPGLFSTGNSIRIQGVVLDPTNAPGILPVVATDNTLTWLNVGPSVVFEGFEGTTNGVGNYPTGWSDGGGTDMWTADSGGTPSSGTGPSAAFGGTQYMFCETSGTHAATDTWIMNSAVYTAAQLPDNAISFRLSRIGSAIGTLEVKMDDGTNTFATTLATFSGSGAEWEPIVITIPGGAPATTQFQFHYTYGGGFSGDLAIDDFSTH